MARPASIKREKISLFTPTPEHIDSVAEWHQRQDADRLREALVPFLRERFGVSNAEAISIIRHAARDREDAFKDRIFSTITGKGGADASRS